MHKRGDKYRQCASVVLLRPVQGKYQMLLVHKPRKKDAWQIPQGGVEEGENTEEAAIRELSEETGVQAKIIGSSKQHYQYNFPNSYRRFRPDNICGQCVHFVFAKANSDVKVKVDEKEINAYAWVFPEQIPKYIKRREYRNIVEKLMEECSRLLEGSA